jgi:hypothetical protein
MFPTLDILEKSNFSLPINKAADTAVTEYWFSRSFGKNTAKPVKK